MQNVLNLIAKLYDITFDYLNLILLLFKLERHLVAPS